jgi:hypothetical protein
MSKMNYFRRYDKDGNCEVICTRCFLTLGVASELAAVREIEALHTCGRMTDHERFARMLDNEDSFSRQSTMILNRVERLFGKSGKLGDLDLSIIFFSVVVLLYVLPTALELAAVQHLNPWLAVIFPGDLIGCAWLVAIFKLRRTGWFLYLTLTACESCLYVSHFMTANALVWVVDLVPTLAVLGMILHVRLANEDRLLTLS